MAFFKRKHWTVLKTGTELKNSKGEPDPALIKALTESYERIFSDASAPTDSGRFPVEGLECCPLKPTLHKLKGIPEAQLSQINAWALKVLETAKAATGEDLVIKTVAVGKGFVAGSQEGPLIHVDGSGTYIHALSTLQGPSTLLFPNAKELSNYSIIGADPSLQTLTVKPVTDREGLVKFNVEGAAIQAPLGDTAIITGYGYVRNGADREGTIHASPPGTNMDRLTLFVDIQPANPKR